MSVFLTAGSQGPRKRSPMATILKFKNYEGRLNKSASLQLLLREMPLSALAARLAIAMARLRGQDLDCLPRALFWKLYDLASDGDPTARLIYGWLGAPSGITPPPIQKRQALPVPCFRHGRFWISAAALEQADITCERQLRETAFSMEGI